MSSSSLWNTQWRCLAGIQHTVWSPSVSMTSLGNNRFQSRSHGSAITSGRMSSEIPEYISYQCQIFLTTSNMQTTKKQKPCVTKSAAASCTGQVLHGHNVTSSSQALTCEVSKPWLWEHGLCKKELFQSEICRNQKIFAYFPENRAQKPTDCVCATKNI